MTGVTVRTDLRSSLTSALLMRPRAFVLSRQQLLFRLATALVALHLLDDTFINPGRGVERGHNLVGFLVMAGVLGVLALSYSQLPVRLRVAISFVFGLLALVAGSFHGAHTVAQGPAGSDLSGLLLVLAGTIFLLIAAFVLLRPKREASFGRRWVRRATVLVAAVALVQYVLLPIGVALWQTQKPRQPIDERALAVAHEDVTFTTSDGLALAGWYVPSRNRSAILLVHGGGGSREGVAQHAVMLAGHGYGVLLYDARGRGESEGRPDGYGWTWGNDVSAALAYLEQRPDVDPDRIGALGLSTGADVLIEVAAQNASIRALVADGATARSFADAREIESSEALPYWWTTFAAMRLFTGSHPGQPLEELVTQISPTPLMLISADWSAERKANQRYARAADGAAQHWQLPEGVGHTHGLRDLGHRYERRVVAFFDGALLSRK